MFLLYIHLYVIQSISTVDNPRIKITNTEEKQSIQKEKKSNHPQDTMKFKHLKQTIQRKSRWAYWGISKVGPEQRIRVQMSPEASN